MFNSFVKAVSGLNPSGKAAETTDDVVIVPGVALMKQPWIMRVNLSRTFLKGKGDRLGKKDLTGGIWRQMRYIIRLRIAKRICLETSEMEDNLKIRKLGVKGTIGRGLGLWISETGVWCHKTGSHSLGMHMDSFGRCKSSNGGVIYPPR